MRIWEDQDIEKHQVMWTGMMASHDAVYVYSRVGVNSIISTQLQLQPQKFQLQLQLRPISRISTPTPTPTPTPEVSTPIPTPTPEFEIQPPLYLKFNPSCSTKLPLR